MDNCKECPILDILSGIKEVLVLLNKVLDHCDNCIKMQGETVKGGKNV